MTIQNSTTKALLKQHAISVQTRLHESATPGKIAVCMAVLLGLILITSRPTSAAPSASAMDVYPSQNIQSVVNSAPGGTTLYLHTGTYPGFKVTTSGLTISGAAGETAVISGQLKLSALTAGTVSNLTIQGALTTYQPGLLVSNSSGVQVTGNTLRGNSFGLLLDHSTNVTVAGNNIYDNASGLEVHYSGSGIVIKQNTIHDNNRPLDAGRGQGGVNFYYTTGAIEFADNTLTNNLGVGIEIYAASNLTIERNVFTGGGDQIETGTDTAQTPCANLTLRRNISYKTPNGVEQRGFILRCALNSLVANNTFDGLDKFAFDFNGGAYSASIAGLRVVNNVTINGRPYSVDFALPASVVIDYNTVWTTSSSTALYGTQLAYVYGHGSTSSWSAFRSWTGYEAHGLNVDPLLVNAAGRDYLLQTASPAIDRGTDVGEAYNGAAPDPGRYETDTSGKKATPTPLPATSTPTKTPAPTTVPANTPTKTPTPISTPGSQPVFSDGFESGNFSAWSSTAAGGGGSTIVESSMVKSGAFAAQLSETASTGSVANARKSFGAAQTELTVSGDFQITQEGASGANVPLFRLFDAAGTRLMTLYRQNQSGNALWVAAGTLRNSTTGLLPLNTWAHLQLHVITAGASASTIEVWLNRTLIYRTNTASLGSSGVLTLQIGNETVQQTFALVADNLLASAAGLPSPASTPLPIATNTPLPIATATSTPLPVASNTPLPVATNTPLPIATATKTPAPVATNTPLPVATNTPLPVATNTPLPVATNTPVPAATATKTPAPTSTPGSGSAVIVAIGDINAGSSGATANRVTLDAVNPVAILGLGDYQYTVGDCANFLTSGHWDSNWGAENWRFWPTFGPTHDYDPASASRANDYFSGNCAGQTKPESPAATMLGGTLGPMQPYSFDVNGWHIVQLPTTCYRYGCDANAITAWLTNDLNAHPAACTIAYFHEAYWTSTTTTHARVTYTKPWVQVLYDHGVELLLQGHNHDYERFYPQNMADQRDDAKGITSFVVGSGGIGFYPFTNTAPNSAARNDATYGVLKLTLGAGVYSWQFLPIAGKTFTDSGSGTCH